MTEQAIKFCCEEVARQYAHSDVRSACMAVPGMLRAWESADYLFRHARPKWKIEKNVLMWARFVEPEKNKNGYRRVGVRVGSDIKCKPDEVPERMQRYIEQLPNMTPEEAYLAFEEIHPFLDGNGRVGKIILFYLRNELDSPSHDVVPNPWGIGNP